MEQIRKYTEPQHVKFMFTNDAAPNLIWNLERALINAEKTWDRYRRKWATDSDYDRACATVVAAERALLDFINSPTGV